MKQVKENGWKGPPPYNEFLNLNGTKIEKKIDELKKLDIKKFPF